MSVREASAGHGDLTAGSWARDRFADPRAAQAVCAALFTFDLVVRFAGDATSAIWPRVATAIIVVLTLLAYLLPWRRLPAWAPIVVALGDLLAMGLSRLDPTGGGTGILMVLPALYLGRYYGRRGVVLTILGGALLVSLPGALYFQGDGPNLSRSALTYAVAVLSAFAMAEAVTRMQLQQRVSAAIVDSVDVGLVLLDEHGTYQAMNRRHLDFMHLAFPTGHAGKAGQLGLVYGPDGSSLVPEDQMPTYQAAHGHEFNDVRIWVGDDPVTRRALSVSARVVRDEAGRFAGAALAYKDVTDYMRALEVKDEFVSSVSHELRTPLTSIHGYAMLLLERDDLPEQARAHLDVVVRNTGRLQRLVGDLLHAVQVDEDALHFERVETDLTQVVRQAVLAAEPAAKASRITLRMEAPPELPLRVDPQRIAQVVDNLVSNALKYTPAGGEVVVKVGIDATRVEIAVTDTGVGITAADRDRLFTRFFRARQASEQSIQGIG
ncbi:MAG: histidine kinase dimerization/phospho-acceptor domain-containing protein, partial [Nocardioides sp.]|nr:histidine kinase dimerization/phospho-acceptor domain-containing protein [Nocardioides sp.]